MTRVNLLAFSLILILGLFLRIFLASIAYDGLIYDMGYYVIMAKKMLAYELVADCCGKNMGYPAFLVLLGLFGGIDNLLLVRIAQIILDLIVAIVVFVIVRDVFSERAAWFSFIVYTINPFTASFTGLRLPEVISFVFIILIAFIITRKDFSRNIFLWMGLGAVLALLLFVRLQFYYFVFIMVFAMAFLFFSGAGRLKFILFAFFGFLVFSSYSLSSNFSNFKLLTLVPPYPMTWAMLYMNFYDYNYPELVIKYEKKYHPQLEKAGNEYFAASLSDPAVEVVALNNKYKMLFWQKLVHEWPNFMVNLLKNTLKMWNKTHLSTYTDPFYPRDTWLLRIFNLASIMLFFIGIIGYIKKKKSRALRNPLILYTALLFFYVTFFFPLVTNESRHSLVFYPLLYLWAGYGVSMIYRKSYFLQNIVDKR